MGTLSDIPTLGFGLGLRGTHVPHILENKPDINWFEIISENYMDNDGRSKRQLEAIKTHYPIVMHGVSLSIGTVDPLNSDYLKKLKALAEWVKPAWISDHLCWTGVAHKNTHDLLPVPYTREALTHIIDRIKTVQDYLGRRLVLENPSTYLEFKSSEMPEEDFIAQMAEASDCGLLLDANNIYVTCYNHRKNAKKYIDALPLDRIAQIHLAGHSNHETHIIDTHDGPVINDVWDIYRYVIARAGMRNTMIEWDDKIPPFDIVNAELLKARAAAQNATKNMELPDFTTPAPVYIPNITAPLKTQQNHILEIILNGQDNAPQNWIREKENFAASAQLNVYIEGYRLRLKDVTSQDYPVLRQYMGNTAMEQLLNDFVNTTPSTHYDAGIYPTALPAFIKNDAFASELAHLENTISQLNFAPESEALQAQHLEGFAPDALMASTLPLRHACELFQFAHNINDYYSKHVQEKPVPDITKTPTYLAVFRHDDTVWRLPLDGPEYTLLVKLQNGEIIGHAIDTLEADEETIMAALPNWFARWINNGLLKAPA